MFSENHLNQRSLKKQIALFKFPQNDSKTPIINFNILSGNKS